MSLFRRRKNESRYSHLSVEQCKEELRHITSKKKELVHRLEILSKMKSNETFILLEDTFDRPKSEVERQISDIMLDLKILDNQEDLIRLEIKIKEGVTKRFKIPKQDDVEVVLRLNANSGGDTRDLFGDVVLSQEEASHGVEKTLRFIRGGKSVRMIVRIPPGVKNGAKIRLKGMGIRGNPSGDLFLIVTVRA